jgi:hypothetical protein
VRTTLEIDDSVLEAARTLAKEQHVTLGAALSNLAKRGLTAAGSVMTDGLPTFDVRSDAPTITPDMVREANEDQ